MFWIGFCVGFFTPIMLAAIVTFAILCIPDFKWEE